MAFRFRKSVKILPGVRLSSSRSGVAVGLVLLIVAAATCAPDSESAGYTASPLSAAESPEYSPPPLSLPASVEQTEGFYAHSALHVRSEPKADARIIRTLARGDYMQLGARDGNGWAGLYTGGVREGYVYRASDAVRSTAPEARTESTPQSLTSSRGRRSSAGSRGYHRGPRGGCYTYTSSGRKDYVDRSKCN